MTDDENTSAMRAAIDELSRLRSMRAELDAEVARQAERARVAFTRHVRDRGRDNEAPDPSAISAIYWSAFEVAVSDIRDALGRPAVQDVAVLAGHGHRIEPCLGGCGRKITWTPRNRQEARDNLITKKAEQNRARYCPECWTRVVADRRQRSEQVRRETDRLAKIKQRAREQAIRGGLAPSVERSTLLHYHDEERDDFWLEVGK